MTQGQPWNVEITERAERELDGLPVRERHRIRAALLRLEGGLGGLDIRKLDDRGNEWGLRVGDYRAIFGIDRPARTFVVTRIGHRREVYRRR